MKRFLLLFALALAMFSCGSASHSDSDEGTSREMDEAQQFVNDVADRIDVAQQSLQQYSDDKTVENLVKLQEQVQEMNLDYADLDFTEDQRYEMRRAQQRMDSVKRSLQSFVEAEIPSLRVVDYEFEDNLVEDGKTQSYPFYVQKGDSAFYSVNLSAPGTVRLYNADTHKLMKTIQQKSSVSSSFVAPNAAVYLLEVSCKGSHYEDVYIAQSSNNMEHLLNHKTVKTELVDAQKGDFRASPVKGIEMRNVFEEPRKFTLRGQLKIVFAGGNGDRAVVAVPVPSGATDILYSLRISTDEGDRSTDGDFASDLDIRYHEIKFLGLPLYESKRGSGLIETLLNYKKPVREEDAYINLFVFNDGNQARKFQDGKPIAEVKYNVDYTTLGTQSCNGRIPTRGAKTIYLGFENERVRFNNYVWLEVVGVVPTTDYFKESYSLE